MERVPEGTAGGNNFNVYRQIDELADNRAQNALLMRESPVPEGERFARLEDFCGNRGEKGGTQGRRKTAGVS